MCGWVGLMRSDVCQVEGAKRRKIIMRSGLNQRNAKVAKRGVE